MFWRILHLLSFPYGSPIAKLAQVHGPSKKGGPLSPRSCSRSTLWRHLRKIRSPKPPFGGRRSGTPKNPKARKDRSRSPRRSKSPSGPRSLEEMQRLREEFPLLRKGGSPSSSGKRVSPWGASSGISKPGGF